MAARGSTKRKEPEREGRGPAMRTEWLLARVRMDSTLLTRGGYARMRRMVMEQFKLSRNTSEMTITLLYKRLDEEAKAHAPVIVNELLASADEALAIARADRDPRGMVAALELKRKICGVGESDTPTVNVNVDGVTGEDRALLDALRLTPAARNNEEKKLEARLAELKSQQATAAPTP